MTTRTALRSLGTVRTVLIVGLTTTLVGCISAGPVRPVAVSDIKTVAGTWKGVVYPRSEPGPASITLTIREDGSYDVVSTQQPIGTSRGKGKIIIANGRLIMQGERGRGVGTVLRDSAGNLMMTVDATLSDNSTLSAELSRSE